MNEETLRNVHKNDLPQKVRNTITKRGDYEDLVRLKKEINNLMWCHLPMKTTLREAEVMACKVFQIMISEED